MNPAAEQPILFRVRVREKIAIFVLLFALVIGLQQLAGAYKSEFGSHPDEAAHYVTGLMVRDYIAAGFPGNPMAYAKEYYDHYPKVALGHWPPIFYLLQSGWTLVFSPSRISILLLMASLAALTSTLLFSILQREFGFARAIGGAALFLAIPMVQQSFGAVMTEIPITLLVLSAAVFYARFLEHERKADSIAFGIVASLAILTKFSGLVLALVPVFAVLLTRKFYLLKRLSFWWPAIIVVVVCGPWILLTLKIASDGMLEGQSALTFIRNAVPFYAGKIFMAAGGTIFVLAVIGLAGKFFNRKNPPSGMTIAMTALLISVLIFHMLVPCGYEARHLVPALPSVIFLAIAGVNWLADDLVRRRLSQRLSYAFVLGVAALAFFSSTFVIWQKGYHGFGPVADLLLKNQGSNSDVFLVASDARGEGMFVSEVALREKRPGHVVRRASKTFSKSSWSGGGYETVFQDESAVREFLRSSGIGFIILDKSLSAAARKKHLELLAGTLEKDAEHFPRVATFPLERNGTPMTDALEVYRIH